MAVLLVAYELNQSDKDYQPVHEYLKAFTHCRRMDSVWLLDTELEPEVIGDRLAGLTGESDRLFVTRLYPQWATWDYSSATWLNEPERNW